MGGVQSARQMWQFAEAGCRLVWRGPTPARRDCRNDMVRSLVGSWYT